MRKLRPFDKTIFVTTATLVIVGFFIFMSASLGLLARDGAQFSDLAATQFLIGIVGGFVALFAASYIPYRFWRQYSLWIFIGACVLTLAVFIPGLGFEFNGARRWLDFGITTFQPAELLKIAYVLYLATWLSQIRKKKITFMDGLIPYMTITGIVALILLLQPDTGTFLVIASAGFAMFVASGARLRDIGVLAIIAIIGFGALIMVRPYVLDRVLTFVDLERDPLGSSYQVRQSLIAVGSGNVFGRGFGQSVQKFNYLPEPTSDSIFAVYAEEFGFIGSVLLLIGFVVFGLRSLYVAVRAPDMYGGLIVVGIGILVIAQSFLNIGAMLGVVPLSGLPLIFVSHGGSALLVSLLSIGIALNVSRFART